MDRIQRGGGVCRVGKGERANVGRVDKADGDGIGSTREICSLDKTEGIEVCKVGMA